MWTVAHGKTCPYCGGGNTFLIQGNEFNIKEIEVEWEERICFFSYMERRPVGSCWVS